MRAETALAAGIALVVVASLVVAAAVPGALAGPEDEPGFTRPVEPTIAAAEVAPETVTLNVTTALDHRGGPSRNLSLQVRATHLESGLVATERRVEVDAIEGDVRVAVPVEVTVPREGGYRIQVTLYEDGQPRGSVERQVRGVGSLTPPAADSSVRFHRFDRLPGNDTLPAVQTAVDSAGDDEVTLNVSAYLTNDGGAATGDLRVQFVLRQAESDLVAARASVPVGDVGAQATAIPSARVTVPDGYNYYVDAILWRGDVIVDSARGVANLDPDESIRVNRSGDEGGLQVEDFEQERAVDDAADAPEPSGTRSAQAPGLGVGAAVLALAGAALLARRRR